MTTKEIQMTVQRPSSWASVKYSRLALLGVDKPVASVISDQSPSAFFIAF